MNRDWEGRNEPKIRTKDSDIGCCCWECVEADSEAGRSLILWMAWGKWKLEQDLARFIYGPGFRTDGVQNADE